VNVEMQAEGRLESSG